MGYWGWRPLVAFVFISVWIVGCTTTPDLTPDTDTTEYPETPFTAYSPPRTQSTTSHSAPLYVTFAPPDDVPAGVPITPVSTSLQNETFVTVSPILCYETTTNQVICYGQIQNMTDDPLHQVVVEVNAADFIDGPHQLVLYEQVLLPGAQAPFHFWLSALPMIDQLPIGLQYAAPYQAQVTLLQPPEVDVQHTEQVYQVLATVSNESDESLDWVQAVLTVFGAEDQVVGYRVVDMGSFQSGESRPLEIRIVPDDTADYHMLTVLGGVNDR